jgi:hypothetical protein
MCIRWLRPREATRRRSKASCMLIVALNDHFGTTRSHLPTIRSFRPERQGGANASQGATKRVDDELHASPSRTSPLTSHGGDPALPPPHLVVYDDGWQRQHTMHRAPRALCRLLERDPGGVRRALGAWALRPYGGGTELSPTTRTFPR